jgi:hypothetical protein
VGYDVKWPGKRFSTLARTLERTPKVIHRRDGGESQRGSWRVKRNFPQVLTQDGFKRSVSVASLEWQLLLFENWIAYVGPCRFSIEICGILLLRQYDAFCIDWTTVQ